MSKGLKKVLQYTIFIGLAVGLMYLAFKDMDLNQMWQDIKGANYWWLSLSILAGFIAFVSRGLRWNVMLEPMGYKPTVNNSVASVIFGYFANLAAPRAGELARCTALNQVEKIPVNTLFGTVILERLIDLILLLVVMAATVLLNLELFGTFFYDNIWMGLVDKVEGLGGSAGGIIGVLVAVAALGAILFFVFRKKIMQLSFAIKVREFIAGVGKGIADVRKMDRKWAFIWHTFVIWFMYWGMTFVAFFAIPETSVLTPVDGLFVLVLGGFGMVVPAQGGLGAYHFIVSMGIAAVYSIGYIPGSGETGPNPALTFATLIHTSQTLLVLVTGAASMLLLSYNRRKLALNDSAGDSEAEAADAGAATT